MKKVKFQRIQANAGLSNSNVTCTYQDHLGYMWIGTEDGLNKFDGYSFKIYRNIEGDTSSLVKNAVNTIFEDSRGVLWVCTRAGGVHYYDTKQDRFVRIPQFSTSCNIEACTEDDAGNVWIGGTRLKKGFAARLDHATNKWQYFDVLSSDVSIISMVPASANEFWIGVAKTGFYKWNFVEDNIINMSDNKTGENLASHAVRKIIKDNKNDLWIATDSGLSKFETENSRFINYTADGSNTSSAPVRPIRDLCFDNDFIWLATLNGGLYRFDIRTNQFINFLNNKNDVTSLSDNSVWSVYKDRQGRLWIGTFSKGLCVIDDWKEKFAELDISLDNDVVNAIYEDSKKRLWLGTEGGVVMRDLQGTHVYTHHDHNRKSLSANPVLAIFEDSKNQIWFGTWGGGVNKFNERTMDFKSYLPDNKLSQSLSSAIVYAVGEDSKTHNLLVTTYHGLNVLTDDKMGKFTHYLDNEDGANNYQRSILEDSKGNLWLGSISEFNLFDITTNKRRRINLNKKATPEDVFVNCIFEDKKARLWVGTNTGLHLLVDKKYIATYTTRDGLPDNSIRAILEDDHGNLWLSTGHGISKFNPEQKFFFNYDVSDGLVSNEFKPNACFKASDGLFLFGGTGAIVFYPDNVKRNPFAPQVYFNDLKLFNESIKINGRDHVLTESIQSTKEITLTHQYDFFTVEYVALNFTSSEKNLYAYKLDGFHQDWNYVGTQRSATFTNLDPGTYTFHVKACNNDGVWNETGASLIIHVLPPWWKALWFRITIVGFLFALMFTYNRLRLYGIRKQNHRLEMMVDERTNSLLQTNKELLQREEEIQTQNEELLRREEEIRAQNEELHEQREELELANQELLRQQEALAAQNEELMQSEEEISTQRDLVSAQNAELEQARQKIEEQNKEIVLRNETLESEVALRTKDVVEYNQQLEQFAFISAHNLRAPVARILGLGQIFEFANDDRDQERMILDKMVVTTKELDRVVRDLNTILEIRKDNTSVITEIDLAEELRLVKINLEREIEETRTQILVDFSAGNMVYTIKPYLDSILINLISNAIKYRHKSRRPVIEVRSFVTPEYFCLIVKDNGMGIDLKLYKDKLFTLYSRFHDHVEGKGMGLYLVKTQVSALGGRIDVESEVNEGVTFRIYLKRK